MLRGWRASPSELLRPGHDFHEFNQLDLSRLDVVVDCLPLWNGTQLAIDITTVSPVRRDGTARAGTATTTGKALDVGHKSEGQKIP